jgi:hypothetical protein
MSSLTSYLAKKGAVEPGALQRVLLNQAIRGGGIGVNLLEASAIEEHRLVELTSRFHRLPGVHTPECLAADPDVVTSLSAGEATELAAVPVRRSEGEVLLACVEPLGRSELVSLERRWGTRVKMAIASPVAVAILLALHHDEPLDPRIARIAGSLDADVLGLDDLPEQRAERIRDIIRQASVEEVEPPSMEDITGDEEEWEDWDDLGDLDAGPSGERERGRRDSIVGKYIIINRIGTRQRRPSIPMGPAPVARREDEGEREDVEQERPREAGSGSRPAGVTPPRARRSSVPPAVISEVMDDYLEQRPQPPPPVSEPEAEGAPDAAAETPAEEPEAVLDAPPARESLSVGRTISLAGTAVPETSSVERPDPDAPPRRRRPERAESKTLPGVRLEELGSSSPAPVQGYPVEVPHLASLPEVLAAIEGASRAGDIIDVLHGYALQFFDFVLMLRYRRGRFEVSALSSRGWAWPVEELPDRFMGYDQLPDTIRKLGQPHLGPVPSDSKIAAFLAAIGRPIPPNALMMPVSLKGRVIVVIHGDNGESRVAYDDAHDLFHATWVATNSLLALLEQSR